MNIDGAPPPFTPGALGMKVGTGGLFKFSASASPEPLIVYALMKLGLTKRSRVLCCRGLVKPAPGKLSLGGSGPAAAAPGALPASSRERGHAGPPARGASGAGPPLAAEVDNFPAPERVLELELERECRPGPRAGSAKKVLTLPLLAVRLGGALAPFSPFGGEASAGDSPFTRRTLRSSS